MAIIIIGRRGYVGDIDGRVARLEALTNDMRRVAEGGAPEEQELRDAPHLSSYSVRNIPIPCVEGEHGQFLGPLASMRHVWMLAPDLGWARTLGGWHRLGTDIGGTGR